MIRTKLLDEVDGFQACLKGVGFAGSWFADHVARQVRFSEGAKLLLPFTEKELSGTLPQARVDLMIHSDDRDWLQGRRRSPRVAKPYRSVVEYRIHGRHGVRWIQAHSFREVHANGTSLTGSGMMFDITDLKNIGDSVWRNPVAPLSQPLNHLAEGVMLAIKAAEDARLPGLVAKLRDIAVTTSRLLASKIDASSLGRVH